MKSNSTMTKVIMTQRERGGFDGRLRAPGSTYTHVSVPGHHTS